LDHLEIFPPDVRQASAQLSVADVSKMCCADACLTSGWFADSERIAFKNPLTLPNCICKGCACHREMLLGWITARQPREGQEKRCGRAFLQALTSASNLTFKP